mmetsp:Transcript_1715/g.3037  ORF Transcript_1715/g.3037 Transcript_1715/m.3037 type:complete len:85 (-) Transcript_1715:2623-2877(-)
MVDRPCLLIFIILVMIGFLCYIFVDNTIFDFNVYMFSSPKQFLSLSSNRTKDWEQQLAAEKYLYQINFVESGNTGDYQIDPQSK